MIFNNNKMGNNYEHAPNSMPIDVDKMQYVKYNLNKIQSCEYIALLLFLPCQTSNIDKKNY